MKVGRPVTGRVKSLLERGLGLHISRTVPSKHADDAIRDLRRWSSADVMFDVGASDGRTILRLQHRLAAPRIFAFEPVSFTYRTLVQRTAHLPNVRTFPVALGAARGRGTMYLSDIASMSSFIPQWTAACSGTEEVEVVTLDHVIEEQRIEQVHFLKVDTEGYELEVLKGAERALRSSRIMIIQLEVGVGQIARNFLGLEPARCYLARRGYFLYGVYNQCRTAARPPAVWSVDETARYRSQVLAYCDALFIRADLE